MKKTGLAVLISIMICAIAIMGTVLFIKFYQDGKENNQREEISSETQEEANTESDKEETKEVEEEPEQSVVKTEEAEDSSTTKYDTYYVANNEEGTPLRQKADIGSDVICQIPLGTAVSYVESASNGFYKIVYNGNTGYALAAYLSEEKPGKSQSEESGKTETQTQPATQQVNYQTYYVVNCKESITLRTSPKTSASEICQIPLGASVSYVESASNGFYKVIYLGSTGYALASYLSQTKTAEVYSAPQTASYQTYYVVNCKESITLRTSPDTSASEICQIPLGASVSYVENAKNGFYKVIYLGNTGYALVSYLSQSNSSSTNIRMQVVNCNESITLRKIPSVDGEEICQIPLGAYVYYTSDAENGFLCVEYNGSTGYALASYLSER